MSCGRGALVLAVLGSLVAGRPAVAGEPVILGEAVGFELEVSEEQDAISLVSPSGPLWQFRYGRDLDAAYFHPLNTAGGRTLTRCGLLEPSDEI